MQGIAQLEDMIANSEPLESFELDDYMDQEEINFALQEMLDRDLYKRARNNAGASRLSPGICQKPTQGITPKNLDRLTLRRTNDDDLGTGRPHTLPASHGVIDDDYASLFQHPRAQPILQRIACFNPLVQRQRRALNLAATSSRPLLRSENVSEDNLRNIIMTKTHRPPQRYIPIPMHISPSRDQHADGFRLLLTRRRAKRQS